METCYLCGSIEVLTNDHIPPKCFFPKPRPSNLISVRCCQTCHRSYAKDDEAFMILLSMHAAKNPAKQWIYKNKTLPSLKTRNKKLARHIWNQMRIIPFVTNRGIVPLHTMGFPRKRMERFLFRLTKGLLRNFYPTYNYSNNVFKAWALSKNWRDQPAVQKIVSKCVIDSRGTEVFEFSRGVTKEEDGGVWLYTFYEGIVFLVMHSADPSAIVRWSK